MSLALLLLLIPIGLVLCAADWIDSHSKLHND